MGTVPNPQFHPPPPSCPFDLSITLPYTTYSYTMSAPNQPQASPAAAPMGPPAPRGPQGPPKQQQQYQQPPMQGQYQQQPMGQPMMQGQPMQGKPTPFSTDAKIGFGGAEIPALFSCMDDCEA